MNNDEVLHKAVQEIKENHHKIIDDWCKAYMAQLYQENGDIKPGDFILYQQEASVKDGIIARKYWMERKMTEENKFLILNRNQFDFLKHFIRRSINRIKTLRNLYLDF